MDHYKHLPESPVGGYTLVHGPDGFNAMADSFEDAVTFTCRLDQQLAEINKLREENAALRAEVERLREECEFWRNRLRIASAKMDGQHAWRLSSSDWPPLVGPDADAVVRNALKWLSVQPLPAPPSTTQQTPAME